MSPGIEFEGLSKSFGASQALSELNLELTTGTVGLLGPNGAGKTTLQRILATVLSPDAGRMRILGEDPTTGAGRLEIRGRLGYLPQEAGLHPGFTAFEFVDYVAILKEMTNRRSRHIEVRRVLQMTELSDQAHRKIKALSGGTRRLVLLAQALLGDPELLVLDEPTSSLDPEQRLKFRAMISRLPTPRLVIISTHQTEDVAALCQTVVVMDAGRVLFQGTCPELVEKARGKVWLADECNPHSQLSWRTGEGRFRHIGDPPAGAEPVPPTIEDAYLLLVGDQAESRVA